MVKLLAILMTLTLHPVHVTLLSIENTPDKNEMNVFLKIYFDDFIIDSGVDSAWQNNFKLNTDDKSLNKVLLNYVNNKIFITVNGKQVQCVLIDYELSGNELRINLVYGPVKKINTINVKNLIMTSLYSDQANMIIVRVADFEEGVKLTAEETEKTFRIN